MKNNNSIKTVVAIGIGAALFFVLGRFVAIPSPVPNTNISLQYAVLGLLAAMYGPVAGGLIGFIGHTLIDLSWGGIPWWSWVISSAFLENSATVPSLRAFGNIMTLIPDKHLETINPRAIIKSARLSVHNWL